MASAIRQASRRSTIVVCCGWSWIPALKRATGCLLGSRDGTDGTAAARRRGAYGLLGDALGNHDLDPFAVIGVEVLDELLHAGLAVGPVEVHRDHVGVHVHGLHAAVLEEHAGDAVRGTVGLHVIERPVDLVTHPGERPVGLVADHTGVRRLLLDDGHVLSHGGVMLAGPQRRPPSPAPASGRSEPPPDGRSDGRRPATGAAVRHTATARATEI